MPFDRRRIGFVAMLATGAVATGCGSNDGDDVAEIRTAAVACGTKLATGG